MIWRCAACYDGECLHSGPIADRSHCPADSAEANWKREQEFGYVDAFDDDYSWWWEYQGQSVIAAVRAMIRARKHSKRVKLGGR